MAWSTPLTAVSNAALTAAQWNASVRDNLAETVPAKATAAGNIFVSTGPNVVAQRIPSSDTVNAAETTTSTSYVNLSSSGPTCSSVVSDTRVIAWWAAQLNNSAASGEAKSSIDISGSTTTAATDNYCLDVQSPASGGFVDVCSARVVRLTVTAGTNTYQMKYRVTAGTGTFRNRTLVVLPF